MRADPCGAGGQAEVMGNSRANDQANGKNGIKLNTSTGDVIGERSLDVAEGEQQVVEGTKESYF